MKAGAAQDCIPSVCRYCGHHMALLYAGQYRKGSTWYLRFRPVDNQGEPDQRPHRCPRSWRVFSTRESASTSFTKQGTRVGRLGQRAAG
jgi:hypothetical protein